MGWGSSLLGGLGTLLGSAFPGLGTVAGGAIGAGIGGAIDQGQSAGDAEDAAWATQEAARQAAARKRIGTLGPSQRVNPYTQAGSSLQDPGATSVQMDPTDFRLTAIDDLRKRYGAS